MSTGGCVSDFWAVFPFCYRLIVRENVFTVNLQDGKILLRYVQKKEPPGGRPVCILLFLREMHVVEDVVLTEAVVPDALAAVTELQIRVVGIRAAADGALVAIALLLGLLGLLLLGLTELDPSPLSGPGYWR